MEKSEIKIAVIIPVYNAQKYIRQCVASVLNQKLQNFRVVLVDDGSADDSGIICDELALEHKEIRVIHQENSGVSAARNRGINEIISSEENPENVYISFLDADDMWQESFFTDEIFSLLSEKYNLFGFQCVRYNANITKYAQLIQMKEGVFSGGNTSLWLHANQHFCAALYSCELLIKYNIRFNEKLAYSEDKMFEMACMYLADTVCLKNLPFYCYRANEMSAMKSRKIGINYFVPIINGYLELDEFLSSYQNEKRGEFLSAKELASIYVMDMAQEHFEHFGSKKNLFNVINSNPCWIDILEGREGIKENTAYKLLCRSPLKYILPRYLKGAVGLVLRALYRIKPIRKIRMNLRYSIEK